MKIPLATAAEKVSSVFTLIILAGLSAVLVCTCVGTAFWLAFVISVLLIVPLGLYTAAVFRVSAEADEKEKKVCVRGIGSGTYDVTGAVSVCTEEVLLGSLVSRRILLRNADGVETVSISTLITVNHGANAEVAARVLADALKLRFVPTVEKYLYDKQAKREKKRADEEAAEKVRTEKREARGGRRDETGERPPEKRTARSKDQPEINYDELDDLK